MKTCGEFLPRSALKILLKEMSLSASHFHLEIGEWVCPWKRKRNPNYPDRVLMLSKRRYKVRVDIGFSHHLVVRQVVLLDTGTGPNCMVESLLAKKA